MNAFLDWKTGMERAHFSPSFSSKLCKDRRNALKLCIAKEKEERVLQPKKTAPWSREKRREIWYTLPICSNLVNLRSGKISSVWDQNNPTSRQSSGSQFLILSTPLKTFPGIEQNFPSRKSEATFGKDPYQLGVSFWWMQIVCSCKYLQKYCQHPVDKLAAWIPLVKGKWAELAEMQPFLVIRVPQWEKHNRRQVLCKAIYSCTGQNCSNSRVTTKFWICFLAF